MSTSNEKVAEAFAKAREAHGQERILVNCAGVATASKTVARDKETKAAKAYPIQQFALTIQINLIGTFRCIASAALGMVDAEPLADGEKGVIINTASVAAEDGQIGQAAYSASKGGVLAMTLPIARDLMSEGIRVNTILPGIFKTPMVAMMPENVQDALGAQVPFPKRLGQPEEYAGLACFLIENSYMNAAAGSTGRRNSDGAALNHVRLMLDDLADAAREAGEAILEVVRRGFEVESKNDRSPVTEADRAAELIILEALSRAAPGIPVVAEEEVAAGRIPCSRRLLLPRRSA